MFESVSTAPRDAILGLNEAFRSDPNPDKINLSVGVYQDGKGKTPVLKAVKQAEQILVAAEDSKGYLGIPGSPEFAGHVQRLLFGDDHEVIAAGRAATSHTPGGTGALRVVGDFLKQNFPKSRLWLSTPTWPNHPTVFAAAGVETVEYPYFDQQTGGIAWDAFAAALGQVPAGDVVLLHGCCHNPTGIDPTAEQWDQIAQMLHQRGALPLIDFAYQGFAKGLRDDNTAVRALCQPGRELVICSSYSKNFGLYRERVGAVTFVAADGKAAEAVQSQVKAAIRANYSNPPAHGSAIVTTILDNAELRQLWQTELDAMRDRIHAMRRLFVDTLAAKGVPGDYSFITRQHGMFSFSGLTPEQVDALRERFSIYIVRSGRINVAGMTAQNMDPLCNAIAAVV